MLLAMGITAFLSVFLGVFPGLLYSILPYSMDYVPYTASHVLAQLQLLLYSALAFALLILSGVYPVEIRAINLDADWFYRRGARFFMRFIDGPVTAAGRLGSVIFASTVTGPIRWFFRNPASALAIVGDTVLAFFSPPEIQAEIMERVRQRRDAYPGNIVWHWPVGMVVVWTGLLLVLSLVVYLL